MLSAFAANRRNQDFLRHAFVIRLYDADTGLIEVTADNLLSITLQHFDNFAFRAATAIKTKDLYRNAVTVKDFAHLAVRQVHIISTVTQHKAVTIAMTHHHTGNQIDFAQRRKLAATVADQLAITRHRDQATTQSFYAVFIGFTQGFADFRVGSRVAQLLQ